MPRVAAIDCGTHSLRLLIADVDPVARTLVEVDSDMIIVRLGAGVDRTGRLSDEALERAFATLDDYAERCRAHGVESIRFVATSATRDASNREDFVRGAIRRIGVAPEVIAGDEEARLGFVGATTALGGAHRPPFLVVDIGGGSTELSFGRDALESAVSMDVGCVRMTERHLHSDPPTPDEIAAAVADIAAVLDRAATVVPLGDARTVVGLAGSVTTVTAHALGLESYSREVIDGTVLTLDAIDAAANDLIGRTRETRAELGFMHPGRVDVIGAGALVWREVLHRVRDEVARRGGSLDSIVTSEHDILDGMAWELAERSPSA